MERIAQALDVSTQTISTDLGNFQVTGKSSRPKGGRSKRWSTARRQPTAPSPNSVTAAARRAVVRRAWASAAALAAPAAWRTCDAASPHAPVPPASLDLINAAPTATEPEDVDEARPWLNLDQAEMVEQL
jgi:hypothetical protein